MLHQLAAVRRQLHRDAGVPAAALRERDAAAAAALGHLRERPAQLLAAWAMRARQQGDHLVEDAGTAVGASSLLLLALGLAVGGGLMSALLRYDGSVPVNLMPVVWVFVVAQVALLALLALALLTPGTRALASAVGAGRLWRLVVAILPDRIRQSVAPMADSADAGTRDSWRWQLLDWSQRFALGFNLGGAGALFLAVTLQDRAFAWSTQVEGLAARVPMLVQALSRPWAGWWPDAVPTAELVAATRYARLDDGSFSGGAMSPEVLGSWWPFLLASVLVYGALPRILSTAWCAARTRSAARRAIVRLPGANATLSRLLEPVQTTAPDPAADAPADGAPDGEGSSAPALDPDGVLEPAVVEALAGRRWVLVDWANTLGGPPGFATVASLHAGGNTSIADEAAAVSEAAAAVGAGLASGVAVAARGYEPPTHEITDLLIDLRDALGAGAPLALVLVPEADSGPLRAAPSWHKHLAGLSDLDLKVVEGGTGK